MLFTTVLYSCSTQKTVTKTVTGVVFDYEEKAPMIGAVIIVKGSEKERFTMTDFDGNFEIEVKKGEVLIISNVCFIPEKIKIRNENEYKVYLKNNCRIWI